MDRYVETTRRGWLSRIGNSFVGALVGIALVAVSLWLLWWNEGRAVERQGDLSAGADAVVSVAADRVDPEYEGRLVHVTGPMAPQGQPHDPAFGVTADGVRLRRTVEMYQWNEEVKTEKDKHLGGSETTKKTYTYDEIWQEGRIDSARFKHTAGHENPPLATPSATFDAPNVLLGAFTLPQTMLAQYRDFSAVVPVTDAAIANVPRAQRHASGIYVGSDPSSPEVGDLRITFHRAPATTVSVLGQQSSMSFTAWHHDGHNLEPRLEPGSHDAGAMFQQLEDENANTTWALRAVGVVMMWIGFLMIFKPLSVVADFIPLVGSIVGFGGAVAGFLLAAVLSLATIAASWVAHRPLLGIPLLIGSAFFAAVLLRRGLKKRSV